MFRSKSLLALVLILSMAGCGNPAGADIEEEEEADMEPAAPIAMPPTGAKAMAVPATGMAAASVPAATTGLSSPTTVSPTAATALLTGTAPTGAGTMAAGAPTLADITATLGTKKNGVLFGMGKFKCTVDVENPSSVPRYGTLTVTFQNGGKPAKSAPEIRHLTLVAGETRTYEFEDTRWTTDDVAIEVTTKPYVDPGGAVAAR